ncbi:hypothetical protein [Flavisphingomonas formosensis]|uniref:hypothetical protein n=1 Tax=Flavisphingomonas formosensis TaxID=861534 RepID=UPI0012FBACCD|nr:hypothetical protein [Sphingomonas formosensis]
MTVARPSDGQPVRKRIVAFLAGFDARGATWYHHSYIEEAARQAKISGHSITIGKRRQPMADIGAWDVHARIDGVEVDTRYEFWRWDDIVRTEWARGHIRGVTRTLVSAIDGVVNGIYRRMFAWSWPVGVSAALPVMFLVAELLAALLLVTIGYQIGLRGGWGATVASTALGGLVAALLLRWGRAIEARYNLSWLGRIISFTSRHARGRVPGIVERRRLFAERLVSHWQAGEVDEILLVGHGLGAQMAVSVLASALRAAPNLAASGPRIGLLTLGQTIPCLAWHPNAQWMRDDLTEVADNPAIDWVDISSPRDSVCFALTDPVTALGEGHAERTNPKMISALFREAMPAEVYAHGNHDWARIHFQYVMAREKPSVLDYFAITAGPQSLHDRFAGMTSIRDFTRFRSTKLQAVR